MFRLNWALRLMAVVALTGMLSGFIPPASAFADTGVAARVSLPEKALARRERVQMPKRGTTKTELQPRRGKNVREYLNPDGTFSTEMTMGPEHYQDPITHVMKPIDNRLTAGSKTGFAYQNGANRFAAHLSYRANAQAISRLELEGTAVTFGMEQVSDAIGLVQENAITYPAVLPGVDLKYEVIGEGIKESIVLQDATAQATYRFPLALEGLTYQAQADGSIHLFKAGESKPTYEMPVPFIYEKATKDIASTAVTQQIKEENRQLFLEVKADEAWLKAPERKFPVIIDPSVVMTGESGTVAESFVSATYPTTNYNSQPFISAGNHPTYGTVRGFMRFDLPSLPDGAVIEKAELTFYLDMDVAGTTNIDLYRVTDAWDSATVNWNNQPARGAKEGPTKAVSTRGYYTFDISGVATDWYNGNQANYGIATLANPESADRRSFEGGTTANSAWRPKLTLTYRIDPTGDQSWWTYVGAVNPFNGNLMLSSTDLSLGGRGPKLPITRTYNSRNADRPGAFGYGWSSILDMSIVKFAYGPAVFRDASGTKHVFAMRDDGTYISPPGIHYSLSRNASGEFTITAVDKTTYLFDSSGVLTKITDANGQVLTMNRSAGSLTDFTDASGRMWKVAKNGSGFIEHIEAPHEEGRNDFLRAYYFYDTSGNLMSVELKQDDSQMLKTLYAYNTAIHQLTAVTDPNGNRKSLTYSTDNRIDTINWTHTGVSFSTTFAYDLANRKTTVTAPHSQKAIYTFNDNGNLAQKEVVISATESSTTTYTWNNWNQLIKVTDPTSKTTNYSYNESGQVILAQNDTGSENLIETQTVTYDQNGNATGTKDQKGDTAAARYDLGNNRTEEYDAVGNLRLMTYGQSPLASAGNLLSSSNPISLSDDLLPNPGFEQGTTGWTTGGTIDTTQKSGGAQSIKLPTSTKATSAFFPVTGSSYYTLTADILAEAAAKAHFNVYWYQDAAGTTPASVPNHSNLSPTQGTQGWSRRGTHVDAPADAKYAKVEIQVWGTGSAWIDNLNFETGSGLWSNNVLMNAGMDYDQDQTGLVDGWYPYTADPGTNVQIDFTQKHGGAASLKLQGVSTQDIYAGQAIGISGDSSTQIAFSGWAMGQGLNTTGTFAMQVCMKDKYGNTTESFQINFDRTKAGWQNLSTMIQATKPFDYIKVYADLDKQTGTAWFDDFKLFKMNPTSSTFSAYNHAENGSFERGTTTPDRWSSAGTATFKWESLGNTFTGNRAVSIANPTTSGSWTSASLVPYTYGQLFTAYTYAKTNSVPTFKDASGKDQTGAQVFVSLYDGAGAWKGVVASSVITGSTEWQALQIAVTPEAVASAVGTFDPTLIKKIQVGVKYLNSSGSAKTGTAYFDNVRLLTGNQQTTYTYDATNNYVTGITTPLGDTVTNDVDPSTGQVKSTTNAMAQKTEFVYDTLGRLTETRYPTTSGSKSFTYGYDNNGNLTAVNSVNGTEQAQQWVYQYSELNLLTEAIESVGTDALKTTMAYDGIGRLTRTGMANDRYEARAYDAAGRLTTLMYGIGTAESNRYLFQYDKGNRLTQMSSKGATDWAYFTYNTKNQLTDVKDIDDGTLKYAYSEKGELTSTTVTTKNAATWSMQYKYDSRGLVSTVTDTGHGKSGWYLYDEAGRLRKMADTSGVSTYYEYDVAGRLVSLQRQNPAGTMMDSFTYVYDANGNVTTITDKLTGIVVEYTYDVRDQLIQEMKKTPGSPDQSITYAYDSLGNRTKLTGGAGRNGDYKYNLQGNRLISAGGADIQYDKAGNMVLDMNWTPDGNCPGDGTGTCTFKWNSAGQLYQVRKGSGAAAVTYEYEYDAKGRRVQMQQKLGQTVQKTEIYHYNGDQVAYVTDANGVVLVRFTYDGKGRPLFLGTNTTVYTYQYNAHGDVVKLTDVNGAMAASYEYDAFGNVVVTNVTGNVGDVNPYRYAGYWYDQGTELYYLKARYYRADLGQFISRDTWGGEASDPLTMNRYTYALNSPVSYSDASGHRPMAAANIWEETDEERSISLATMKSTVQTPAQSPSSEGSEDPMKKALAVVNQGASIVGGAAAVVGLVAAVAAAVVVAPAAAAVLAGVVTFAGIVGVAATVVGIGATAWQYQRGEVDTTGFAISMALSAASLIPGVAGLKALSMPSKMLLSTAKYEAALYNFVAGNTWSIAGGVLGGIPPKE